MKTNTCVIDGLRISHSTDSNMADTAVLPDVETNNSNVSVITDDIFRSPEAADTLDVACLLDVSDYLPTPSVSTQTSIQQIAILCQNRMRLVITNKNEIRNKHIIGYFIIENCDIYWSDLARSASAFDLRVLSLTDRHERFSEEQEEFASLRPPQNSDLKQLPIELQNIGSLVLRNSRLPADPLSSIFVDFLWPKLAEIIFFNISISEIPLRFQTSMPRLQALDLPINKITHAPTAFPWAEQWMNLPLNLSRTPNMNDHYSQSQGFFTPPNLYRRVVRLVQNSLRDLQQVVFRGCLQKIDLSYNVIEHVSNQTFSSVICLQNLVLSFNRLTSVPLETFSSLSNLTHLDLSHNMMKFVVMSDHFVGLERLEKLDLSHNQIATFGHQVFHPLTSLIEIDLSANRIADFPDNGLNFESEKLQKVNLQHNVMSKVPHWVFLVRNLLEVDLSYNSISFSSFMDSIRKIDILHLIYSNVWDNQFGELQRIFLKVINLQNNNFTTLDVSNLSPEEDLLLTTVMLFFDIDLDQNELVCDCQMYSMHLYLLKQAETQTERNYNPYARNNWKCATPPDAKNQLISSVANTTFKCEAYFDSCPSQCKCLQRVIDQVPEVDCSYSNLTNMPENLPENTQILNMAHNNIQTLYFPTGYLKNLQIIDLSFNNISLITDDFLQGFVDIERLSLQNNKLQELPKPLQKLNMTSIFLRSNPWKCDCHSVWFKQWIVASRQIIEDLNDVTCASGRPAGSVVIEVPETEFVCEISQLHVVIGVFSSLILIIIILALIYKYRGEIKVFLYIHFKWHPFSRSEKSDVDFKYDAFVSYAGDDYKWVVYQLVNRLEGHVPRFKLCLHDRDFEVGAPIHQNIMDAVKTSRHMVLVLTRQYLASEWCMLEFRAAHERVLNDRSNYLILVLFDDVPVKELDDDMQLYLRTNTYLSVSNKWFWEKLLYAMPKEPLCTLRDDVTFDFPHITEPPKSYPDYLMGYMAQNQLMARRSELPQFQTENEEENKCTTGANAVTHL